jgi:hypothetical protein
MPEYSFYKNHKLVKVTYENLGTALTLKKFKDIPKHTRVEARYNIIKGRKPFITIQVGYGTGWSRVDGRWLNLIDKNMDGWEFLSRKTKGL